MALKDFTENKYTLNDIFTKKYEIWLIIPAFIYLLTPIVQMIVYSFTFSTEESESALIHFLGTGENVGDYYMAIIKYSFLISAFVAIFAFASLAAANRQGIRSINKIDFIPFIVFSVYLVLIIISSIVNKIGFVEYVLGISNRSEGVISVFCYFLVFYLCGSFVRKESIKRFVMWFFLATSVVIGILSLVDRFVYDLYIVGNNGFCGIFYHWNFYAYYLTMAIMIAASIGTLGKSKAERIIAILTMCFNTFLLAINDSLGGFLACCVAFVFLVIASSIKNKRFDVCSFVEFLAFLVIIFITGLFTPSFFSELTNFGSDVVKIVENSEDAGDAGTARWTLWTHTVKYIKMKPWIGWGYEGSCALLGTETHADRTHNEYLENMAFYGVPAGLIYVVGLVSVYVKALIKRKSVDNVTLCCLVGALGYIGSAFVGNSFIFAAPFFFIFLGLANNTCESKVSNGIAEELSDVAETISSDENIIDQD